MKNYAIVGFIYNQPCPLKCNFCCHTHEVVGREQFDSLQLVPILIEFSKHTSVTRFAYSGGDPFLYVDEILQIMSLARAEGVRQPFHMVTSAFWASDPSYATDILTRLKSVGMDALDISYDAEHARFVPVDHIYRAVELCLHNDIRVEVFGTFWHQGETVRDLLPALPEQVPAYSNLVMPVGAARAHFSGARYSLPTSVKMSCGKPRVYDVAIYPNGDVFPCCSGGFNKEAKLQCGNIFKDTPAQILQTVFSHFHVRIAKEIGFGKLYDLVSRSWPELKPRLPNCDALDSVCQICHDIHADDELRAALSNVYEQLEIEYAIETVERDFDRLQRSGLTIGEKIGELI
jgi:Radical SAM superfamily/4Fe-4S single cluster domain